MVLSIDGGLSYIKVKDMTDEQVQDAIWELKCIASGVDDVRIMFESVNENTDREWLSTFLEKAGNITIECNPEFR